MVRGGDDQLEPWAARRDSVRSIQDVKAKTNWGAVVGTALGTVAFAALVATVFVMKGLSEWSR